MQQHVAAPRFADYSQLCAYLEECGLFRIVPGLDRIEAALDRLGLRTPPYAVVQVVGTNGKGSTSTMLASISVAHEVCTGLYTSPHFLTPRERIRINGAMLPETEWTRLANTIMARGGDELSYFELVTVMAVLAFAEHGVELAVMETGLGGSWDATTALAADLVVFTPIALDHESVLGPTIARIAADKGGAMRPGKPALSQPQEPEATAELQRLAADKGAFLTFLPPDYPLPGSIADGTIVMRLGGAHQLTNARLALAAWRNLTERVHTQGDAPRDAILEKLPKPVETRETSGLAAAWLPGRMQQTGPKPVETGVHSPSPLGRPPLLLDGAHNAHGLAALGLALAQQGIAPAAVVFSCLMDKNLEQLIPHLRALATGPVFVPPIADNPRAMLPQELATLIGVNAVPVSSLQQAVEDAASLMATRMPESFEGRLPKSPLLVCGSLYLLGELYALFPDLLD